MPTAGKKIAILCEGSRGDIQPFVALSLGLQDAGYEVHLWGNSDFEEFAGRYGVRHFHCFDNKARDLLQKIAVKMNDNYDMENLMASFQKFMEEEFPKKIVAVKTAITGMDFVLVNAFFVTYMAVYKAQDPSITYGVMHLQPALKTSKYPPIFMREEDFPPGTDFTAIHEAVGKKMFEPYAPMYNKWRNELGLPDWTMDTFNDDFLNMPSFHLNGFSQVLVPHAEDWPAHAHTAGYWTLHHSKRKGWAPEPQIQEFIDRHAPEKPVYIGFGSMIHDKPDVLLETVVHAVEQTGVKAIMSEGWGTLHKPADWKDEDHPNICFVNDVDHTWLMPKCRAAVIHGGAGTTSAACKAGIPLLVLPFLADQPFWALRTNEHNCGPTPVSGLKVTKEELIEKLTDLSTNEKYMEGAKQLQAKLLAEDGTAIAVELIEATISK